MGELKVGDLIWKRGIRGAGTDTRELYYPCTVVEHEGKLAARANGQTPSYPPGYGLDHEPGYVYEMEEDLLEDFFKKRE